MSTSTTSLNLTQQAWFGAGRKGGGQTAIGSGANLFADLRAGSVASSASRTNPFRDALREAASPGASVREQDRGASAASERVSARDENRPAVEPGDNREADARGGVNDSSAHEKTDEARDSDRDASRETNGAAATVGLVNANVTTSAGATDGAAGVGAVDGQTSGDAAKANHRIPLANQVQLTAANSATAGTAGAATAGRPGDSSVTVGTLPIGNAGRIDRSVVDDGAAVKSSPNAASAQRSAVPSATLNASNADAAQASASMPSGESAGEGRPAAVRGTQSTGSTANDGVLQSKMAGSSRQAATNAGGGSDAAGQLHAARHDLGDAGRSAQDGRNARGAHADARHPANASANPTNAASQSFAARNAQQVHGRTQRTGVQLAMTSKNAGNGSSASAAAASPSPGMPSGAAPTSTAAMTPSAPTPVNASALPTPASAGTTGLAGFIETTTQTSPAMQQQMMRGLSAALRQGGGRVTLRLAPADLGSIRVDVKVNGPVVEATFEATNDGATKLLSREIDSLRTQLEDRGFRVEKLVIRAAEAATETGLARGTGTRSNEMAELELPDDRAHDANNAGDQDNPADHRSRGHARTQDAFATLTEGIRS